MSWSSLLLLLVVLPAAAGVLLLVGPLLLPAACAACGRRGRSPCLDCEAALRRPPPLPPPPGVDRALAVVAYEDEGRELVARLKYRNARSSLPWLADRLATLVDPTSVDVVTWVPTSGRRRRRRGFDQSELLARALARRLRVPCRRLLRRGPGPPQTGRPLAERRRRPPLTASVPRAPARILVVDDVCTSGASLAAAAAALRSRGARTVVAATAARALPRPLKVVGEGTDHRLQ